MIADSPSEDGRGRKPSVSGGGQARSSIVQVQTGALETYLNTLKKTVSRHEEELLHPSWWDAIKTEVDKVTPLCRRVDHVQLDIASIRDFLLTQPTADAPRPSSPKRKQRGSPEPIVASPDASQLVAASASVEGTLGAGSVAGDAEVAVPDAFRLLRNDVEAARLLIRRIEMHQAVEVAVFKDVKDLKSSMQSVNQHMKEDNTNERLDTLEAEIANCNSSLRNALEETAEELRISGGASAAKINDIGAILEGVKRTVDGTVAQLVEDTAQLTMKLSGDNDPDTEEGGRMRDALREVVGHCAEGKFAARLHMCMGLQHMHNALKIRRSWRIKICFGVWKKMFGPMQGMRHGLDAFSSSSFVMGGGSPQLSVRRGQNGMEYVERFNKPVSEEQANKLLNLVTGVSSKCFEQFAKNRMYEAFYKWRNHTYNREAWGRLKQTMAPLISYWYHRTSPDLKLYLRRWRFQTLLLRRGIAVDDPRDPSWRLKPVLQITPVDSDSMPQQASLMAHRLKVLSHHPQTIFEGDGRSARTEEQLQQAYVIIGECLSKVARKLTTVDTVSRGNAKDIRTQTELMDRMQKELDAQIKGRFEVAEKSLSSYKAQVIAKFTQVKSEANAAEELRLTKQLESDARFEKVEARLSLVENQFVTTEAKLDRVLLLQGNLLERLKSMEDRVQKVEESNSVRELEVAQALKSSAEAVEGVANSKAQAKDSFAFFDDEVKYLKVYARRINEDLKQFMTLFTDQAGKSKSVSKELRRRVEVLADIVELNVTGKPTPEELFKIYEKYEKKVIASQSRGRSSTAFPPDLSDELAKFAFRLADYVSREVDVDVLRNLVIGPQPPSAKSAAHTQGAGAGFAEEPTKPEEEVAKRREECFQGFNNLYLQLFTIAGNAASSQQTGTARSEARATFHRRFIAAVEAAMSKHDALIMMPSSTLMGNNKDNHCMSCNRPLHTAVYKSSKTWQQTLMGYKEQELRTGKADPTRSGSPKRDQSPSQSRPSSAYNHRSSAPAASGLYGNDEHGAAGSYSVGLFDRTDQPDQTAASTQDDFTALLGSPNSRSAAASATAAAHNMKYHPRAVGKAAAATDPSEGEHSSSPEIPVGVPVPVPASPSHRIPLASQEAQGSTSAAESQVFVDTPTSQPQHPEKLQDAGDTGDSAEVRMLQQQARLLAQQMGAVESSASALMTKATAADRSSAAPVSRALSDLDRVEYDRVEEQFNKRNNGSMAGSGMLSGGSIDRDKDASSGLVDYDVPRQLVQHYATSTLNHVSSTPGMVAVRVHNSGMNASGSAGAVGGAGGTMAAGTNMEMQRSTNRPASAGGTGRPQSAGGSKRHKNAIKEAYVLRGGFKMPVIKPDGSGSRGGAANGGEGTTAALQQHTFQQPVSIDHPPQQQYSALAHTGGTSSSKKREIFQRPTSSPTGGSESAYGAGAGSTGGAQSHKRMESYDSLYMGSADQSKFTNN